jgi:hypothetical protein
MGSRKRHFSETSVTIYQTAGCHMSGNGSICIHHNEKLKSLKHLLFWFEGEGDYMYISQFQWLRGLMRRSAAAHLLRLWLQIPPGTYISVYCECWILSGRGLCDELITHPEESYQLWCVVVCDIETSWMRRPRPTWGLLHPKKESIQLSSRSVYLSN